MGRKAFVTSGMSADETLIEVGESLPIAPMMWPFLVAYFDDWGRAECNPVQIKAKVFPLFSIVTIADVRTALELFAQAGLILRYEVTGRRYMAIDPDKWFGYQTHIRHEKRTDDSASKLPRPTEHDAWWENAKQAARRLVDEEKRAQLRATARGSLTRADPSSLPPFLPSGSVSGDRDNTHTHSAEAPTNERKQPNPARELEAKAKAILAGCRSVLTPNGPAFTESDWRSYKPRLIAAAKDGFTAADAATGTRNALQRWSDPAMVNPGSVAVKLGLLLAPVRGSPNGANGQHATATESNKMRLYNPADDLD